MARRRGEVDDFMWILAIALILIVAVGIFSYFVPYTGPLTNITVSSFSPGEVGYVQDYVSRVIDLRTFTVGEEQLELLKAYPQMELSAGLLGGESEETAINVPNYLMDTARDVTITFDIYQTNNYGNLVVKWNGREIANQALERGRHELFIDREHVKGSNTLEVYTTGPGFMFWASSVYILKNFNVNLMYGPQRIIPFEMLSSEMETFDRVELNAYASGTGTLQVKINGVDVYSGSPTGTLSQQYTLFDAPVRVGQNILTFIDETGTYTLRDTVFRIYTRGDRIVASHRFNMSDENYNFLANSIFTGKVEYLVENIARQGVVDIEVNSRQLSTSEPRLGWNSATFTANLVNPGDNLITISGTGSFRISSVVIGLER